VLLGFCVLKTECQRLAAPSQVQRHQQNHVTFVDRNVYANPAPY
jgi:hypothetical protein